jgi:shikimate dehydrogenase
VVDRYAVVGNPVAHSLSPDIHAAFADQTGESLSYERIEAPIDGFTATVEDFFRSGGRGLNVTVPFKGEAAAWVTRLDAGAAFAEAVNTIVPDPAGGFVGHNTDGPGLVMDIERLMPGRERLSVLLLGAGGAARGVAAPLLDGPAGSLTIANRTRSKADSLADKLRAAGHGSVKSVGFDQLDGSFDLVINATSTGLDGQVPAIREAAVAGAFCYDMLYGVDTAFCRWARKAGAGEVTDGLGMLVGQAAFAFELWRGVRPQVAPVLEAIRRRLAGGSA